MPSPAACGLLSLSLAAFCSATRPVEQFHAPALQMEHDDHLAKLDEHYTNASALIEAAAEDEVGGKRCCCQSTVVGTDGPHGVSKTLCEAWSMFRDKSPHWYHASDEECCWQTKWPVCMPTFAFLFFTDNNGGSKADDSKCAASTSSPEVEIPKYMWSHMMARSEAKHTINAAFLTKAIGFANAGVTSAVGTLSSATSTVSDAVSAGVEASNAAADAHAEMSGLKKQLTEMYNEQQDEPEPTTTTDVQNPSELKFDDTGVVTVEYKNLAGVDTDEQDLDEGQKKCVDMSWPKPTDEKGGSKPMPVGEVCITKQSAKLNLFAVFELGEEIDKKYHKKTED